MIPTQYVRSKERSMQRKRTEERAPNPTRGNNARSAFTLRRRGKIGRGSKGIQKQLESKGCTSWGLGGVQW